MDKSPGIRGRRSIEQVIQSKLALDKADFDVDVENRVANLERRGGGVGIYEIKVFEDINVVLALDGAFYWPIPQELDKAQIIAMECGVSTPSGAGPVEVQVAHSVGDANGPWLDILSTKMTIEAGEYNSADATIQPLINGTLWSINHKDWLRIDIDAAGSSAKGLALMVTMTPSPLGSIILQGYKGDPGGITQWKGVWVTATGYSTGQAVSSGGSSYVAIQDHTSGSTTQPGVGASWQSYWMLLLAAPTHAGIELIINGLKRPIDIGNAGWVEMPFAGTIVQATLVADLAGSMVVDIRKDVYGSFPPTSADSITGGNPLTLTTAIKTQNTSLTGWTTALSVGDILAFEVVSSSVISLATVSLKIARV